MHPFKVSLELLKRALGEQVSGFDAQWIKTTFPWSLVHRVTLQTRGHSVPESVIVKAINPEGPTDPKEGRREYCFYQSAYRLLPVPKPDLLALTIDDTSGWSVIVLEDLYSNYRIPQHPYKWSRPELQSVLRAYAALHATVILPLESDLEWLNPRHEDQLHFELIPEQVQTVQRAGIWGDLPELPDLIAFARASCVNYGGAQVRLLHNDTTPTNAPLPKDPGSQPALLIDWQDAGIGMPEMDLAYIDQQPFESGRLVPRAELLEYYWQCRAAIEGQIPSAGERASRQLHADVIMALWLTRPASRVAVHPYPAGTYPRMHWDSHFGIIYDRLKELGREIQRLP